MHIAQVFLNTQIMHLGFWHHCANYFLTPVRFWFCGKTIMFEQDNQEPSSLLELKHPSSLFHRNLAKVTSFFSYQRVGAESLYAKKSKQSPQLKSTEYGNGYRTLVDAFIMLALFLPGLLIGGPIKWLTYLFNPIIRMAHAATQERLKPKDIDLGTDVDDSDTTLAKLKQQLATGQKVDTLTICAGDKIISQEILSVIRDINPARIILIGDWKTAAELGTNSALILANLERIFQSRVNPEKWQKWDFSALHQQSQPKIKPAEKQSHPVTYSHIKHKFFILKEDYKKDTTLTRAALLPAYSAP